MDKGYPWISFVRVIYSFLTILAIAIIKGDLVLVARLIDYHSALPSYRNSQPFDFVFRIRVCAFLTHKRHRDRTFLSWIHASSTTLDSSLGYQTVLPIWITPYFHFFLL